MRLHMNPVEKALWFIENKFASEITLDEIADVAGVSRYHMSRAFGAATSHSVIGYVRARRLTEAARCLAAGAPDILAVALDAGYGSHEAFTRAFREQFGLTPEQIRAQRHLDNIALVEPIRMDKILIADLEPPRFENGKTLLIAGIGGRYTFPNTEGIPAQWQRLVPHFGHVVGQVGGMTYGVSHNMDDFGNFDYLAGVEVSSFADLPDDFSRIRIPEHRYAVFSHRGHISSIPATHNMIWNKWLPESGHQVAESLNFERYDKRFDPQTGTGVVEIWMPIKA
jgi:AraC family transcriptional regulator